MNRRNRSPDKENVITVYVQDTTHVVQVGFQNTTHVQVRFQTYQTQQE